MREKPKEIPTAAFGALRKSGFPFQTAIAHVLGTVKGWSVYKSEYPWQDSNGKDEFLDLVITNKNAITNENWYAAVECKKTEKETFTFLRPLGSSHAGEQDRVRCLNGAYNFRLYCGDWLLFPGSYESQFCIVSTDASGSAQRLLERDARLVVCATDAFAKDQEEYFKSKGGSPASDRLYISIIVTNAPIYAARYKPSEVSLKSGRLEKNTEEFEAIPWIRFRKAFTSSSRDMGERTVFVVKADEFGKFLELLEKSPGDDPSMRNPIPLR